MKFMLAILENQAAMAKASKAEMDAVLAGHMKFGAELQARHRDFTSNRLRPPAESSIVKSRGGDSRIVTDGPFAETKESLGGYYLIDCESKQEAIEWARKIPLLAGGAVEVRQVWEADAQGRFVP